MGDEIDFNRVNLIIKPTLSGLGFIKLNEASLIFLDTSPVSNLSKYQLKSLYHNQEIDLKGYIEDGKLLLKYTLTYSGKKVTEFQQYLVKNNGTGILVAVTNNKKNLLQELIKQGANINDCRSQYHSYTPLHLAVEIL